MRLRRVFLALGFPLILVGSAASARPQSVATMHTIDYANGVVLDEYLPPGDVRSSPVAVLVHGCCGDRRDMAGLARALARRGVVVLNADVHRLGAGGGWPESYGDVVCAVAMARAMAGKLPGADHRIALVGWSDGALVGAADVLGWRTLAPRTTTCAVAVGNSGPDLFVGIGGHFGWPGATPPPDVVTARTVQWFGARPDVDPGAWQLGNPRWWLTSGSSVAPVRVHLIVGEGDEDSGPFLEDLRARNIPATMATITQGTSLRLIQPRDEVGILAFNELVGALDGA